MRGTGWGLGWLTGIVVAQVLPVLPGLDVYWLLSGLILCLAGLAWRKQRWRGPLLVISFTLLGMVWACTQAQRRLDDALLASQENRVSRVAVLVAGLPEAVDGGVRFLGELLEPVPVGLPRQVLIDWPSACTQGCLNPVVPGQRWRMALRFRSPHARLNFDGFDGEAWLFAQGVRATARVRGSPQRLRAEPGFHFLVAVQRLRHQIRQRLLDLIGHRREARVMVALAIGDQQGVSTDDWQVFNRTGITHLVSISGSHVTLIAALGGGCLALVWRRTRWRGRRLCERWPVRLAFVWGALSVALLYCLLAGWGVPAQRTFFMLGSAALALTARLPISGPQALVLAGFAITVLDPWAVLSSGFWLSFGAMAVLIAMAETSTSGLTSHVAGWARWRSTLWTLSSLQLIITLATLPVLAYLFNVVSLVSLPANAWAIPAITFVATPLALLAALGCALPVPNAWLWPLVWLAHEALAWSLVPVRWLAGLKRLSWEVATMPIGYLLLALFGVVVALVLPPLPWRRLGWCLMLPGLFHRPPGLSEGSWRLTAFDIGQGGALLVQTATQALLFDTGWRFGEVDAVTRVVLPALQALGVQKLDHVVISHPDMDHVGGLDSLRRHRPIGRLHASGLPSSQAVACRAGQAWQVDGVRFSFLHPQDDCSQKRLQGVLRNRCSCVLRIQGAWHSALLTGDIDQEGERQMLAQGVDPVTLVTMPHHGSITGSSAALVNTLQARHAIAQTGHHNRFGHPAPAVVERWRASGAQTWISAVHGAVRFESSPAGLKARWARQSRRRYWHTDTAATRPRILQSPKMGP